MMPSTTKECPGCRRPNAIDAVLCQYCGYSFHGAAGPVYPYAAGMPPAIPSDAPTKVAAGVLAILLGGLGIHAFYMRNNTMGIIILLVTILGGIATCGIASAVMGLLTLVQGIIYLMATDLEFHRKYVIEKRWF